MGARASKRGERGRALEDEGARESGGARAALDWRRWLAGASPREVLARIVPGDPLGLRARVARRLGERALLLDADRVHLACLARCGRAAPRYRGHPALDEWLDARVEETLDDLLEARAEPRAEATEEARADAFALLAPRLGLEARALREAARAFHALPLVDRRAFFALVLEQRPLDGLAREAGESASAYARRARRALLVLLRASGDLTPARAEVATEGGAEAGGEGTPLRASVRAARSTALPHEERATGGAA